MPLAKTLPIIEDEPAMYAIVNRSKSTPVFSWRFDRFWEGPTYLVHMLPYSRLSRWFIQHVTMSGLGGECIVARNGKLLAYARHAYSRHDIGSGLEFRSTERFITTVYKPCGFIGRLLGFRWRVRTYYTRV